MASLPKIVPGAAVTPPAGPPDSNPFALPVARNLSPKPGESLFSAPPPAKPKFPEAQPKIHETPPKDPEVRANIPEAKPMEPAQAEQDERPIKELSIKPPRDIEAPPPVEGEEKAQHVLSDALALPDEPVENPANPLVKKPQPAPAAEAPAVAAPAAASAPASKKEPAAADAVKPLDRQQKAKYIAVLAGAALGLISLGAAFTLFRSDPHASTRPIKSSPFGKHGPNDAALTLPPDAGLAPALPASTDTPKAPPPPETSSAAGVVPAPVPAPAPAVIAPVEPPKPAPAPVAVEVDTRTEPARPRPTATFTRIERPTSVPSIRPVGAPVKKTPAPRPKKPAGSQWAFEGTVYDLISTQGVYGARLLFFDADDNEIARVVTGEDGEYHVAMAAGPQSGYAMRVAHEDYSGKRIDELDSTSSVRKADLEQRKFLMQTSARSLPWIGTAGKSVRRDMALVPKVSPE